MNETDKIEAIKMRINGEKLEVIAGKFGVTKQYINALTRMPEKHLATDKAVLKLKRLMAGLVWQYETISAELEALRPSIESLRSKI